MNLEPITSIAAWLLTKGDSLWSGAIGSLVAGLVAAGVALYVVKRTTYNATCDSVKQMNNADRLTRQTLAAGQGVLERQLKEQQNEASKAREIAAIADLLSAVNELNGAHENALDQVPSVSARMYSAVYRWAMEGDNFGRLGYVLPYVSHLVKLTYEAGRPGMPAEVNERVDELGSDASMFITMWIAYPNLDADGIELHWDWMVTRPWATKPAGTGS